MGSLTSTPSAPAQPQVVYVPAPAPVSTAASTAHDGADTFSASGGEEQGALSEEERQAAARARSLLERSRGRFGTIQTGFRGLLGLAAGADGQRKTLLGE